MPKLVAQLRVKDGILFIDEWLENIGALADEIVAVDNGSTDGTYEKLKAHPKVVDVQRTEGFHEGRDKLLLYELARKRNPDWNIWLDVDEIFEKRVTREKLESLMNIRVVSCYGFRRIHFKDDLHHFYAKWIDLLETSKLTRHMWREQTSAHYSGAYVHDGGIYGIKGLKWYSNFRIKHICQINQYKKYRTSKYTEALEIDPANSDLYKEQLNILHDNNYPSWRYYEYPERPIYITIQNFYFTFLMVNIYFIRIVKKLGKLLRNDRQA